MCLVSGQVSVRRSKTCWQFSRVIPTIILLVLIVKPETVWAGPITNSSHLSMESGHWRCLLALNSVGVNSFKTTSCLPRFDKYSLRGVTTPRQEIKDPEFHRKQMTVFILFIHGLCNCLRIHFKYCLIPFLDDERLHMWSLLKVYVRGAVIGKNPTDMLNILLINVWQDIVDDLRYIPKFFNIFAFDVWYQHPWMQQVMDDCSSGHVNTWWLNFLLVCTTNSWLS